MLNGCVQSRKCSGTVMLDASTVYNVNLEFRRTQPPLCEATSRASMVKYPLESVVNGAYCKAIAVKVRVDVEYRPYNC